jgi:hypothetical protein
MDSMPRFVAEGNAGEGETRPVTHAATGRLAGAAGAYPDRRVPRAAARIRETGASLKAANYRHASANAELA